MCFPLTRTGKAEFFCEVIKDMHEMYSGPMEILDRLITRYPVLASSKEDILAAYDALCGTFAAGNTLYLCGNGGSASDCGHIAGELMKAFTLRREPDEGFANTLRTRYPADAEYLLGKLERGLPAVPLTETASLVTAVMNDTAADTVFAQQVYAMGKTNDALLCISTSGNSRNCVLAAQTAQALGMRVISLTGGNESKLSAVSDVTVAVGATETYKVQELHLPVYHALCLMLEYRFFGPHAEEA